MEYIEECDDDGEDSLDYNDLMPCLLGKDDNMEDDDNEYDDQVLIHRQDPDAADYREQGDSPDSSRIEEEVRKSVKEDVMKCKKPIAYILVFHFTHKPFYIIRSALWKITPCAKQKISDIARRAKTVFLMSKQNMLCNIYV